MAQIITNNSGGGGGSSADAMLKSVYDPQNINADAFDYDNFTNTPTIPTVNDATLTIQKNSTDVATFTANASSNVTANISVPTDTSDLTNGAGFITNSALSGYQTTSNLVTDLTNPDNTHYPSSLAVKNAITAGGNGDVSGPASSVNGDVAVFDGTSGKLIKDSGITLGTAASCDTGTSSGNVPLLDSNGKLNKSTLPGVALTDTFTVSTSSDLTSLSSAEQGDLAIVTTESKTYVLSAEPYSTAANWKEILSPTGGVTSVNSQTGAVTLDADDISDSTTTNKFVTASDKTTWSGKQDALVSGTNIKTVNGNSLLGSGDLVVSGNEYNAGEGIDIGADYSAMQGPAPSGFHVPLNTEWQAVYDVRTALGGGSSDGTNFGIALKLPFAGIRHRRTSDVYFQGTDGYYWSSFSTDDEDDDYSAYCLRFSSSSLNPQYSSNRDYGYSVRCFRDTPIIPTSSWTKLYGTSIEAGGIFWSSTDGLISLSSDGQTWTTIADKNLGATQVWNNGDVLLETNCGGYSQWGNNYMFPFTGSVTTSYAQVDASGYGPGNYYNSSTFIIDNDGPWDTSNNRNLWGGLTGIIDNVIKNTGVLSVNGQAGDVSITGVPSGGNNGDVLTNVSGTPTWSAPSGGDVVVSSQSGNILTSGTKLWAGLESDYQNLGSYDSQTIYLTI